MGGIRTSLIKNKNNMKKPTIQKLLYIPTELYDPLLILAAKTSKGNLNACIVNCIKMALDENMNEV